jgi:malate permease and related proteins
MTETLFQAYAPLLFWTGLGIFIFRFLPQSFPRLLGRSLYWVGIPLEIFALARQIEFSWQTSLAPILTVITLFSGLGLSWLALQVLKRSESPPNPSEPEFPLPIGFAVAARVAPNIPSPTASWQLRSRQGSFLISSMLGNTGFVGLAIAPVFVSPQAQSWLVLYSVTQNVIGTYGIGVFLSSYYGRSTQEKQWWTQIRDVATVPSLWAFAISTATRSVALPEFVESGLHASVWVVIPAALLLMGMRMSQLRGWQSLRLAIAPTVVKALVMPVLVGVLTPLSGIGAEPSLALVLMAGMPTAFAGLILAEEYELDRELIASSIVLSTCTLLLTIPLWLVLFGHGIP